MPAGLGLPRPLGRQSSPVPAPEAAPPSSPSTGTLVGQPGQHRPARPGGQTAGSPCSRRPTRRDDGRMRVGQGRYGCAEAVRRPGQCVSVRYEPVLALTVQNEARRARASVWPVRNGSGPVIPSGGVPGAGRPSWLAGRGAMPEADACFSPIRMNEMTCCCVTWVGVRFLTEWGEYDANPVAGIHWPGGRRAGRGGRMRQQFIIIECRRRLERVSGRGSGFGRGIERDAAVREGRRGGRAH